MQCIAFGKLVVEYARGCKPAVSANYIFSNTTLVLTNEDTKGMHTFLKPDSVAMQTGDNTTSSVATVLETATTENIDL